MFKVISGDAFSTRIIAVYIYSFTRRYWNDDSIVMKLYGI